MGIPDHLTCLLRNLCVGQQAIVRTRHGTTDLFQVGKRICQGCTLSTYFFNFHAKYIMWNARLDKIQAGIKIAGRKVSNLRYTDGTTLMAESEELKSLLMEMEEEISKAGLKLSIQVMKMSSSSITSWQIDGETVQTMTDFILGALKSLQMATADMKLKDRCSLEEKVWPT